MNKELTMSQRDKEFSICSPVSNYTKKLKDLSDLDFYYLTDNDKLEVFRIFKGLLKL